MPVATVLIKIITKGNDDVVDITLKVAEIVSGSKIKSGLVNVFVSGSTASVTTIEYEPGLVMDVKALGERLAPSDEDYSHNDTWGDGNGHSHIKASVIGPSLTVPFTGGKMALGIWQQIVIIDHDTRARSRDIVVQVIGE
jgi:secondary thiamine-phosphate synthase enzyme